MATISMTRSRQRLVARLPWVLLLMAGWLVTAGCARQTPSASDDQQKVDPVSETAPKFEPLARTAPLMASATTVESVGDCAPKYLNGLHGACINHQACRGIGVLDANSQPVCSCYGKAGGCAEIERCDAIKKVCVSENEPGFGRAADD